MEVNTTIKAILVAALAAISYTIPQAQADTVQKMQDGLDKVKDKYTDVYALTFTVREYKTVSSQGTPYGQTILQLLPCSSGTSAGDDGLYLISVYNSSSRVSAIDRVWLSADDNKCRTYKQKGDSSIDTALGSVTSSGNTNTYNLTLTSGNYPQSSSYGVLTQGQNHSGITSSITNATYTVAYDGTNTTVQVTTTDNITNKVVFRNTKLNLQNFLFYSGEKGIGNATIVDGTFNGLTDVYTWNGSDALIWDSRSWSLGLADGQSFKSGSDVAFNNQDANTVQADSITAGNVAVNVDQTIVVAGDDVTFGSTTIADGKTLTLRSTGGTIDLGEVSMVGAKLVVDASEGHLVLLNESAKLEVATMTIDGGYHVDFFTDVTEEIEGTVTITESLTATAGDATLNANLTLVGGSKLNLNGAGENALTLGSTLTLDTESGLIQLDDETMLAIAALENVGDYVELVLNGGAPGALSYIGDEWFDGVFSRTYTNEEGLETQLTGDYNVLVLDNGNFGIQKFSNVPEPTTGTLSLLALAALAARRRRH